MYSRTMTGIVRGIDGIIVSVECDVTDGLPMFDMVGFLSSEAKEAKERVRSALKNSGFFVPAKRITINLSPANIHKSGTGFDLPIAIGLLSSIGQISSNIEDYILIGELNLNGDVLSVPGVLSVVLKAKAEGYRKFVVPFSNLTEALLVNDIEVFPVSNLSETVSIFNEGIKPCEDVFIPNEEYEPQNDFSEVNGQLVVKRACEIAAAGMHNLLMIGPPGSGKTMIAKRIPSILPPLTENEQLELTRIYSASGKCITKRVSKRPFRSPHHTISEAGLAGGGAIPRPGEISLAHKGVLFLDELPEFRKSTLEILRQPMEEKGIEISRQSGTYYFPSEFVLVAAMNPCNCGYFPDLEKCRCTPYEVNRYLGKISQPLLDRIDLCVEAPKMNYEDIKIPENNESSNEIRKRVIAAHNIQRGRFLDEDFTFNSLIPSSKIEQYCPLGDMEEAYMEMLYKRLELTARTYHKLLRVARTIADLDGEKNIQIKHLQEASLYRTIDKKYWEAAF